MSFSLRKQVGSIFLSVNISTQTPFLIISVTRIETPGRSETDEDLGREKVVERDRKRGMTDRKSEQSDRDEKTENEDRGKQNINLPELKVLWVNQWPCLLLRWNGILI